MGEQKRREEQMTDHERFLQALSRKLTDEGKLVEAGWIGLRNVWLHPDTPPAQVADLRNAFMAGAQHLLSSIMTIMDPGEEPAAKDLARLGLIDTELRAFGEQMMAGLATKGSA